MNTEAIFLLLPSTLRVNGHRGLLIWIFSHGNGHLFWAGIVDQNLTMLKHP